MRIVDLPAYAYPWNFLYGLHPLARVYVQERQRDLHLVHFHSVFIPENVQLAIIQRRPYVLTPNGGYSLQVLQDRQRWCKSVWLQLRETAYIQQAALIHAVSPPERAALRHLFPGQLVIYIPNAVTPPLSTRQSGDDSQGAA